VVALASSPGAEDRISKAFYVKPKNSIFSQAGYNSLSVPIVACRTWGNCMIALSCPSCQKKLSVKEELAGKKIKCPGCGSLVAVTQAATATLAMTGSANLREERTLPPRAPVKGDEQTLPPKAKNKRGRPERISRYAPFGWDPRAPQSPDV
jgi:DNA-directed RNA polymerase subunit RPC12/RpoP